MIPRQITLFRLDTGAITATAVVDEGVLGVYAERGLGYLDGHWPGSVWRMDLTGDQPVPVALTAMPVTVSDNLIEGIPPGTLALFDGQGEQVDDGNVEFALDLGLPETIRVTLINPLWLTWEGDVPCL